MEHESVVPQKSPNDQRDYEAVYLANGLKVLLVYDQKAEKAACSISVGVGSLHDGQTSLGLAHFLEHMLFMGSRKFPKHNEYSQFMSLNSGMDNAYTSDQETNYYFEIANNQFGKGVERITDFFVEALLTSSCIEKERQAVHEECMLRCAEDNSRKWQILKHFASGPYHNHSIGNKQTLGHSEVGKDLVEFYQTQYSANRINAVLLSALPIADMKTQLLPFFQEIQNKNLPALQYELHYQACNLGKLVQLQSIKDESIMQFFWVIESTRPHYHLHPEKYIAHVLGHEGKNSLLSLLKQRDYACRLTAYSHDMPRQTIVGMEIQLTETGEKNYQKVYNLVIDYTSWLKAEQHIYEEIREASTVSFQFKEKSENYNYVCDLSSTMHRIPLQQVISYRAHYAPYNANLIDHFLQQLNPFNLLLVYSHPQELKNPITEKYLGGKFIFGDLPPRVNSKVPFASLIKNPFLPLDITVLPTDGKNIPEKIDNIWFVRDDFKVCKGGIKLRVHRAQSETFAEFYSTYLELLLKEMTYEAESLKLQVEYDSEDQLSIEIFGFSHTVQQLLEQIGQIITSAHLGPEGKRLFKLNLEDLIEDYQNFYEEDVDETTETLLSILLRNTSVQVEATIKQLHTYNYQKICKRIDQFWKGASLEWIVVGNFDRQAIRKIINQFASSVKCDNTSPEAVLTCLKVEQSAVNITELSSQEIGTSGCIVYHQIGQYNELLNYTLSLLRNYIKQPFFDKLRTEKQLAYYLRAYSDNTNGIISLCFILISSNVDPHAISAHIKQFVQDFIANIQTDLTEQKFTQLKDSLRTKVLEPHNSLKDFFNFICKEVEEKTFVFDRKDRNKLEGYLNQIKREDVINLLKECTKKALEVWVVAKPHEEQFAKQSVVSKGCEQIKETGQYYPQRKVKFD